MSKQERSNQSSDKQQKPNQKQPAAKQREQQAAPAQSGAKDRQQQAGADSEKQPDTGHHQNGGFAGWEADHKKDLKEKQ